MLAGMGDGRGLLCLRAPTHELLPLLLTLLDGLYQLGKILPLRTICRGPRGEEALYDVLYSRLAGGPYDHQAPW